MTLAAQKVRHFATIILMHENATGVASPLWDKVHQLIQPISREEIALMHGGADESWNSEDVVGDTAWEIIEKLAEHAGL